MARGLETRNSAYAQSGTVDPQKYLTPFPGGGRPAKLRLEVSATLATEPTNLPVRYRT